MLYTHFTEELLGLQEVKMLLLNFEKDDTAVGIAAKGFMKITLFCHNITE